jgi:plastocyanin domain-containing protein
MIQNRLSAAVVLLLVTGAVAAVRAAGPAETQQGPKPQIVKLSFDDKGYVVTPSRVTKGVPVRMEVDLTTVKGCMRTVVIAAFDVKKTVKEGDTTIEFTPTKSGEIQIVCGMNMGKGSFSVAEPR